MLPTADSDDQHRCVLVCLEDTEALLVSLQSASSAMGFAGFATKAGAAKRSGAFMRPTLMRRRDSLGSAPKGSSGACDAWPLRCTPSKRGALACPLAGLLSAAQRAPKVDSPLYLRAGRERAQSARAR